MIEWMIALVDEIRAESPNLSDSELAQEIVNRVNIELEGDPMDRAAFEAIRAAAERKPADPPEIVYIESVDKILFESDQDYVDRINRLKADPDDDEAYTEMVEMVRDMIDQQLSDGQLDEMIDGYLQKYLGPAQKSLE